MLSTEPVITPSSSMVILMSTIYMIQGLITLTITQMKSMRTKKIQLNSDIRMILMKMEFSSTSELLVRPATIQTLTTYLRLKFSSLVWDEAATKTLLVELLSIAELLMNPMLLWV